MAVDVMRDPYGSREPLYKFKEGFADCQFCKGKGCISCDVRRERESKRGVNEVSDEEWKRREDFGPNGDATTPGFFIKPTTLPNGS